MDEYQLDEEHVSRTLLHPARITLPSSLLGGREREGRMGVRREGGEGREGGGGEGGGGGRGGGGGGGEGRGGEERGRGGEELRRTEKPE